MERDNMSEEEKQAIEILKQEPDYSLSYYKREKAIDIVLNLVEKQRKEIEIWEETENDYEHEIARYKKEIEELREENFDTIYMKAVADYKSKIKEILEIEGNVDIAFYLKHLVAENNRLEDIEDDRDCNYVSKDKIREKMREIMSYTFTTSEERHYQNYAYYRLKELLEE